MAETLRFRVEKLIRDRLPEIMRAQGLRVFERTLSHEAFVGELKAKLAEEAAEARAAGSPDELLEELADVLEVTLALAAAHGFTPAQLEARREAKHRARGGFSGRVYNAAVEAQADCPAVAYYLARPEHYPQIPARGGPP